MSKSTRSSTLETLRNENKVLKWKPSSYEEMFAGDLTVSLPDLCAGDYNFKFKLDADGNAEIFIDIDEAEAHRLCANKFENMKCENIRLKEYVYNIDKENMMLKSKQSHQTKNNDDTEPRVENHDVGSDKKGIKYLERHCSFLEEQCSKFQWQINRLENIIIESNKQSFYSFMHWHRELLKLNNK